MVRLSISSLAIFSSLLTAKAAAKDVLCLVNDSPVATVDLDTGVCPFQLPAELVAFFDYASSEDYNVQFYYAIANSVRYFTDIVHAGTEISIPANQIYGTDGSPVFQVHVENTPASNSTAAIKRRMLEQVEVIKRDEASDFAESLKSVDGTLVNSALFRVVDAPSGSSSIVSGTPTGTVPVSSGVNTVPTGDVTETLESTKVITVTHCSDNKCSATTVPATPTVTTYTVDGTVTSYTTYCPLTDAADVTETVESTKIITVTQCSDNKCSESTVAATPTLTTETIEGTVTAYTTYCPVSEDSGVTETVESTKVITVTQCSDNKCSESTVAATPTLTTETIEGTVTAYTTYCPVSEDSGVTGTVESTKVITVTQCSDNKCSESTVAATPSLTTETIEGTVTAYTTYCPVSENASAPGTAAPGTEAPEATSTSPAGTTAPGTEAPEATSTSPAGTTAPGTEAPEATSTSPAGTAAPGTEAPESTSPAGSAAGTNTPTVAAPSTAASSVAAISTYEASAVTQGSSLLALLLVSLVHFF